MPRIDKASRRDSKRDSRKASRPSGRAFLHTLDRVAAERDRDSRNRSERREARMVKVEA